MKSTPLEGLGFEGPQSTADKEWSGFEMEEERNRERMNRWVFNDCF